MKIDETLKKVLRDYVEAFLFAVVIAIVLRVFFVAAYKIPTNSMAPTLQVGDFVLASKSSYGLRLPFSQKVLFADRSPERGEVVIFVCPNNTRINCVKRVVAVAGDRLQIIKKNLLINNQKATYLKREDLHFNDVLAADSVSLQETLGGESHAIAIEANKNFEDFGPVVVPPGYFFVLGDARDRSEDSRMWGSIPVDSLRGKVSLIWMSLDWSENWQNGGGPKVRWHRIFSKVK